MRKALLIAIILFVGYGVNAQADSLQQYVGKYKFPDGSVVSEVTITLENGGLTINASIGSSALVKEEGEDMFTIVAYQGLAKFKRDSNKKIIGVTINAMGYTLEGSKESLASDILILSGVPIKKFGQPTLLVQ